MPSWYLSLNERIGSEVSFAVSRRPSVKSPIKGHDRNNRLIMCGDSFLKIPLAEDHPRPPIVAEAISGRADARRTPVPTETRSERSAGGGRRALELLRSSRCDGSYCGVSCQGRRSVFSSAGGQSASHVMIEVGKAACSPVLPKPKLKPLRLNSSFNTIGWKFLQDLCLAVSQEILKRPVG